MEITFEVTVTVPDPTLVAATPDAIDVEEALRKGFEGKAWADAEITVEQL